MHGDLSQGQRTRALERFENGTVTTLIATDVAAGGLDLDDVTHVINSDPPDVVKAYTHRVGRTGRAWRSGTGVTFSLSGQQSDMSRVCVILNGQQETFASTGRKDGRTDARRTPAAAAASGAPSRPRRKPSQTVWDAASAASHLPGARAVRSATAKAAPLGICPLAAGERISRRIRRPNPAGELLATEPCAPPPHPRAPLSRVPSESSSRGWPSPGDRGQRLLVASAIAPAAATATSLASLDLPTDLVPPPPRRPDARRRWLSRASRRSPRRSAGRASRAREGRHRRWSRRAAFSTASVTSSLDGRPSPASPLPLRETPFSQMFERLTEACCPGCRLGAATLRATVVATAPCCDGCTSARTVSSGARGRVS